MNGVSIESFGYLHGQPPGGDLVFDLRDAIRDPHIDPAMRQLTGLDGAVCRHVLKTPGARDLIASITEQAVVAAKRRPVRVLIGCQGGRHRSVVVALEVAKLARLFGVPADVTHHHVTQPVIR